MSHETQQKQILENITIKGVKDTIFANIKKVVNKYDILLQEYYDELDFKEKNIWDIWGGKSYNKIKFKIDLRIYLF